MGDRDEDAGPVGLAAAGRAGPSPAAPRSSGPGDRRLSRLLALLLAGGSLAASAGCASGRSAASPPPNPAASPEARPPEGARALPPAPPSNTNQRGTPNFPTPPAGGP